MCIRPPIIDDGIILPSPANGNHYTKPEVAEILITTKKRSKVRGEMIRRMIEEGYVPAKRSTIEGIIRRKESGETIADEPWLTRKSWQDMPCKGIQSSKLDKVAPDNLKYCYDAGLFMDCSMTWHAKGCSDDGVDKYGRCTKCRSAYKHMNPSRHPKLFGSSIVTPEKSTLYCPPAVPELPDDKDIGTIVSNRLEGIKEDDIPKDPMLVKCAQMLLINESIGIEIGESRMFMVCVECENHRICQKRSTNSRLCTKCMNKSTVKKWQQERREQNFDQRTSPYSHTPLTALTPYELKVRGQALKMLRRSKAATIKRLKDKIASHKIEMEMNQELLDHMHEALEFASSNEQKLHASIETALLDLLKQEAVSTKSGSEEALLSHEDTKQLVSFIAESMKNHIHKVNGHTNRYRFSPYLMGFAMGQYLQDGTAKYDQMREDNVIVMPSSGTLAKKKYAQQVRVGNCIIMYEKQLLIRQWLEEMGQLMCDEMKLQEDVLINISSDKMVGFTEDFICKKKILLNLLDDDKIDSLCEPAKYVNQWRYRSVNGRSFNCEFWFNGGSLKGDGLLEQFIQVVMHCEIIGARVLGFVCDAGGSNARLMKLLRGKEDLPEGGWLPEDMVRTVNPYDPTRYISLFHCSTHDLKAMRNQLFTSWRSGGKKQFLDENGNPIGKGVLEECFERDRLREMRNHAPLSEVRESTIILNKWSKMNVKEAKRAFSWKTLVEIAAHLYEQLGVPKAEQLRKENHPLGYMAAVAKHLKALLTAKSPDEATVLAPKISSFEWLANVHEMFNAILMNTDMLITWHNIDRYEQQVRECLNYFDGLRQKELERREDGDTEWELSFMSSKTWTNLRITCRGFFHYCRSLIEYADYAAPGAIRKFCAISPAHSNSSSIEAWFACTRHSKQDSASSYAAWVSSRDMFKAGRSLRNNKMYSADDVGEISAGRVIGPNELIKFHEEREEKTKRMINQFEKQNTYAPAPAFSSNASSAVPLTLASVEKAPLLKLAGKSLPQGYLAEILKQDEFRQWLRLSIGTKDEKWFQCLFEDTIEPGEMQQFNEACRLIQQKLFEMTIEALRQRNNENHSFEYDLHDYHRSADFAELCWSELPGRIAESHPGCVILLLTLAQMQAAWLKDALRQSREERNPELFRRTHNNNLTEVEQNNEVNRFLGWAIFSSKGRFTSVSKSDVECKKLLSAMMIYEREIDDEYMEKYYDPSMSLLNCGGLTLVNKTFFPWAKQTMNTIRDAFDEERINRDPQHAFEKAKQEVMSNGKTKRMFVHICKKHSLAPVHACDKVFEMFLRKAIHARFAVVFRRWKEAHVKKNGQVAFRTKLKAQNTTTKKGSNASSEKKVGGTKQNNTAKKSSQSKANGGAKKSSIGKRKKEAIPFSDQTDVNRKRRRFVLDTHRNSLKVGRMVGKIFPNVFNQIMLGSNANSISALPPNLPFSILPSSESIDYSFEEEEDWEKLV